jgi:Ca2+-binding EF-hand superfamily protein|eukprot:COSAG01_NODE_1207_length_11241_cov_18.008257_2_plen_43_part_00
MSSSGATGLRDQTDISEVFNRLDANQDGVLDEQELRCDQLFF